MHSNTFFCIPPKDPRWGRRGHWDKPASSLAHSFTRVRANWVIMRHKCILTPFCIPPKDPRWGIHIYQTLLSSLTHAHKRKGLGTRLLHPGLLGARCTFPLFWGPRRGGRRPPRFIPCTLANPIMSPGPLGDRATPKVFLPRDGRQPPLRLPGWELNIFTACCARCNV